MGGMGGRLSWSKHMVGASRLARCPAGRCTGLRARPSHCAYTARPRRRPEGVAPPRRTETPGRGCEPESGARGRERHPRAVRVAPDSARQGCAGQAARRAMTAGPGRRTSRWYHDPVRPLDDRGVLFSGGSRREATRSRRHGAERPAGRRDGARAYQPAEVEPRSTSAGWMPTSSRPTARAAAPTGRKQPFVITQPPPNVTGALHIGHALDDRRGR